MRKAGFQADELDRDRTIRMNKENFALIAQEQFKKTDILLPEGSLKLKYMERFQDKLKLNQKVLNAMAHYEIEEPTPVQSIVISYITDTNCDMVVQSQASSGKSNCFFFPIIDYIIQAKNAQRQYSTNSTSPYAIIVAPTRELVVQLACDATRLTRDINWEIKIAFSFGGQNPKDANNMIRSGCDILVLTAGRLYDYFGENERNMSRLNTSNLKFVVLDEADRLLKPTRKNGQKEFKESNEIIYDFIVKRLTLKEKRKFRCFLFSATIDFDNFRYYVVLENLIVIKVGGTHPSFNIKQSFVEIKNNNQKQSLLMDIVKNIAQHYQNDHPRVDESEKVGMKTRISKIIIFVNDKRLADRLALSLNEKSYEAFSVSSDRTVAQRLDALEKLKSGELDILVSTDVLSRGINVPKVDYIINYDLPNPSNKNEYIHRIGRCGRLGNLGHVITIFYPNQDWKWCEELIEGCKAAGQEIPSILLETAYWSNDNYDHRQYNGHSQRNSRY